ncbi:Crp/Fnr family transcriptional regulator [Methyloligella solikamskensis]|uniref:Crp/Fnr family transcriptional regulator n=1 Tax=Methyloligella solikamskensis TaxID=1177756 RepID=A0ABW3JAZ4_9HYPH
MTSKRLQQFDVQTLLAKIGEKEIEYEPGTDVFSQGDTADAVFYISKGKVKIRVLSDQGKEAVVALLGEEQFFGESCLVGQLQRIATATTITAASITRIAKSEIVRMIHADPAFSESFIIHLLNRAVRTEADLVDQLFNSSEKRLARTLLLLANFGSDSGPQPVIAKISQETLAQMIGTTRGRVSFFMNKFRKLGFISYNGRIEVHQSLLNAVLHDQPHVAPQTKEE